MSGLATFPVIFVGIIVVHLQFHHGAANMPIKVTRSAASPLMLPELITSTTVENNKVGSMGGKVAGLEKRARPHTSLHLARADAMGSTYMVHAFSLALFQER